MSAWKPLQPRRRIDLDSPTKSAVLASMRSFIVAEPAPAEPAWKSTLPMGKPSVPVWMRGEEEYMNPPAAPAPVAEPDGATGANSPAHPFHGSGVSGSTHPLLNTPESDPPEGP